MLLHAARRYFHDDNGTSKFRSAEKHLSGGSTAASEQQGTIREETSQPTMK